MSFRDWMNCSRVVKGNQPLWPWLLGAALDSEFQRQRSIAVAYKKEVFKDRDNHNFQDGDAERRMTASLYHRCLREADGCLSLGGERIWLLGYEWPNQGGDAERGRRADLVGLRQSGGIIVFECKKAGNSDPPLTAALEGLDYLACLMRQPNFDKILSGFEKWRAKPSKSRPIGFEEVRPIESELPSVIVLAPDSYYSGRHERSRRGGGWRDVASVGGKFAKSFQIGFAVADFKSPIASWIT